MKKLVIGITAPSSVILLKGQCKYFVENGYEVYLMAPDDKRIDQFCETEHCKHLVVPIEREISLLKDFKSLYIAFKHLLKVKPDIVNVGTPKIALVTMLAAFITRVPYRIYTCRGFRFEHETGFKQKLLIGMEKITVSCAHKVICISPSVRELGFDFGILKRSNNKAIVVKMGSSNGIDLSFFNPGNISTESKKILKASLDIENSFVFGFVGRIVDRKGINELFTAFNKINSEYPNTKLLILGREEGEQIANKHLIAEMKQHPAVIFTGPQMDVPLYLSVMNIFVLPAWWEGFGNVIVQASAMGIPVISTNATGCKDAVLNNYSGILCKIKSVDDLYEKMELLLNDKELCLQLGDNGKLWAKNFDSTLIWKEMEKVYNA